MVLTTRRRITWLSLMCIPSAVWMGSLSAQALEISASDAPSNNPDNQILDASDPLVEPDLYLVNASGEEPDDLVTSAIAEKFAIAPVTSSTHDLSLQAQPEQVKQFQAGDPNPAAVADEIPVAPNQDGLVPSREAQLDSQAPTQPTPTANPPPEKALQQGSSLLGHPEIHLQGVYKLEGDESSTRARVTVTYPVSPSWLLGTTVDLTTGEGFSDSPETGLQLSELYTAVSPANAPTLRFTAGLMDLTAYFDRNSFAKDGASQFFNRAFQTNPALSAAGLSSRIGLLAYWDITDNVQVKAATFSANRELDRFTLDSVATEVGVRFGTVILRGTYVSSRDAGQDTGFEEIYSLPRSTGDLVAQEFGLQAGDREHAYGINAEAYLPTLQLGLFARYGWYKNETIGEDGQTYSFGITRPNLFMSDDRLGIAYGRQLSNDDLRRRNDNKIPDVLEVYYDMRIGQHLRLGVTFQQRDQFSETILGFRVKTDFDISPRRRF